MLRGAGRGKLPRTARSLLRGTAQGCCVKRDEGSLFTIAISPPQRPLPQGAVSHPYRQRVALSVRVERCGKSAPIGWRLSDAVNSIRSNTGMGAGGPTPKAGPAAPGVAGAYRQRCVEIDDCQIQNPARYIGGEVNSVMKEKEKVDIRFAMCFPDLYEIGMSHLGIQILYDMFNRREDTWCERVYSPWTDLDKVLREKNIPLFALESQDPVRDFDFLGITIQFEMCYTNILQILDLSRIPLHASDRTEKDPFVIGGGPCTCNPEPLADFF